MIIFPILDDEQMSNKVRVEHQPAKLVTSSKKESYHSKRSPNNRSLRAGNFPENKSNKKAIVP